MGFLLTAFTPAFADVQTKITAINGNFATVHETQLNVNPGDTISLTADQVDFDNFSGAANPLNRNVEDFTWSSDAQTSTGSGDSCDPQYSCAGTNFEVNSYGVNFYVPYTMGQSIVLTVQNRIDGTYDQLTLVNASYASAPGGYIPPSGSYSDPTQYPDSDFDYNRGLAGHGRWVYIDGERTFIPYSYQADWQPYQNGYWTWTSYGWTWQSYDPWGWITDHYGYWRHHRTYGWCWFAGEQPRWSPAVVTFYHTDEGIGWYPYSSGFARGYVRGYEYGYDDGYWDGYNAGLRAGSGGYVWGGTYVYSSNFCGVNVYGVRVIGAETYYGRAYSARTYGPVLVSRGYSNPRVFVESRIGRSIVETRMDVTTRNYGGRQIQFVHPSTPVVVPAEYRQVHQASVDRVRGGAVVPVGTVVRPGGRYMPPSRPVVVAPRVPNGNGGYTPMPERTRIPATQPRPVNPNPAPSRPSYPTPAPSRPSYPTPAPSRPSYPTPAPSRPSYPTPAPSRPSYPTPAPSRPSYPTPAPSRPSYPTPAPRRPGRP